MNLYAVDLLEILNANSESFSSWLINISECFVLKSVVGIVGVRL